MATPPLVRYPDLLALLASFPPAEGWLELRARHPDTERIKRLFVLPTNTEEITRWLAHRQGFTDAFMGIARRDGTGGGKDNLVSLPALWVDLDADQVRVPEDLPAPTAIVASGRGHHLYWALDRALPLDATRVRYVDLVLRGLARRFGGDVASAEAAHVLRIPGTLNAKYQPPRRTRLVHLEDGRRVSFALFTQYAEVPGQGDRATTPSTRPERLARPPANAITKLFAGCTFLRWAREQQADVSEPLWHAALTNLAPFSGGQHAALELSEQYPRFKLMQFRAKFAHARDRCRPHTCQRIALLGFEDCARCPWWGRIKAPASLAYTTRRADEPRRARRVPPRPRA